MRRRGAFEWTRLRRPRGVGRTAVLALLVGLHGPAHGAAQAPGPGVTMASQAPAAVFIQDVGRQLGQALVGADTLAERRRRLVGFIGRVVDVPVVAQFCLGRYWRLATPAQRQRFQGLFLRSLTNAVALRASSYQSGLGHVTVGSPVEHADGLYVPTLVQAEGKPEVHVAWVVEAGRSPFRIVDVMAEGMSLRLAKRSDFTAYITQHGGDIDHFLDALQRQVGG